MNILVNRQNPKGDLKAFKRMLEVIDNDYPLVIFPEGTISKNAPKMSDFKPGAMSIGIKKQIPILPVTFSTNWKRLQRSGFFKGKTGPGISEVIIHKPIETKGLLKKDSESLSINLQNIIEGPLKKRYPNQL